MWIERFSSRVEGRISASRAEICRTVHRSKWRYMSSFPRQEMYVSYVGTIAAAVGAKAVFQIDNQNQTTLAGAIGGNTDLVGKKGGGGRGADSREKSRGVNFKKSALTVFMSTFASACGSGGVSHCSCRTRIGSKSMFPTYETAARQRRGREDD